MPLISFFYSLDIPSETSGIQVVQGLSELQRIHDASEASQEFSVSQHVAKGLQRHLCYKDSLLREIRALESFVFPKVSEKYFWQGTQGILEFVVHVVPGIVHASNRPLCLSNYLSSSKYGVIEACKDFKGNPGRVGGKLQSRRIYMQPFRVVREK